MIRNLTWQQLAVFALCLASAFAAHRWLGLDAGMAAGVVTSIIAFLMGRNGPSDPPPGTTSRVDVDKAGPFVGALFWLSCVGYTAAGCGANLSDVAKDVKSDGETLKQCRAEARGAFFIDGKTEQEALAVYERCKKDGGL